MGLGIRSTFRDRIVLSARGQRSLDQSERVRVGKHSGGMVSVEILLTAPNEFEYDTIWRRRSR